VIWPSGCKMVSFFGLRNLLIEVIHATEGTQE
jgi:hypothetical protein